MDLQSLHTKYHVHALLLHPLAPLDVALLVETGEELHHGCDLLAIAGGGDEGLDHLGVLGQPIESGLDGLHLGLDGGLAEQADVAVEAVVGNVDEAVLDPYLVEQALGGEELWFHQVPPLGIAQLCVAAVGKRHKVLVVLVASSGQGGVEFFDVEPLAYLLDDFLGHGGIVDNPYGLATLSAVHAGGDLLHRAIV